MLDYHALVAEDGDAGDGVHVFGVQEVHELGQVVNVDLMLAEQRMFEGDGNAAVGIFDVEDDGVAADLAPVADNAEPVIAGGHDAGEIDGADFEIFGDGDGVLDDGCGEDSGDGDLFAGLENVAGAIAVGGADGVGQFARSEIACVLQILVGEGRDCVSAPGGIELSGRGEFRLWNFDFGYGNGGGDRFYFYLSNLCGLRRGGGFRGARE